VHTVIATCRGFRHVLSLVFYIFFYTDSFKGGSYVIYRQEQK